MTLVDFQQLSAPTATPEASTRIDRGIFGGFEAWAVMKVASGGQCWSAS
jgi:hypothetical protein